MIRTTASCDGPDCKTPPTVTTPAEWPGDFIVITLDKARGGLAWPTGRYGFCSCDCLIRWAGGR